jgi:hypothetical protein
MSLSWISCFGGRLCLVRIVLLCATARQVSYPKAQRVIPSRHLDSRPETATACVRRPDGHARTTRWWRLEIHRPDWSLDIDEGRSPRSRELNAGSALGFRSMKRSDIAPIEWDLRQCNSDYYAWVNTWSTMSINHLPLSSRFSLDFSK